MISFDEMLKKVNSMQHKADNIIRKEMIEGATIILSQAKAITPVKTGALRRSLTYGDIKRIGETYNMIIGSSLSYFDYVENGHYQEVGRYVPAIGKKLKKGFVQGKHMISQSVEIYQEEINKNIMRRIREEVLK